jgi:hypothetical protein
MAGEFEDALTSCTAERALILRRLAARSEFVRPHISTFRMLDFNPDDSQTPRKLMANMTNTSNYAEYNALQTSLQYVRSADEFRLAIMRLNEFLSSGQRDEIYPIFHPRLKVPVYLRRGTSDFQSFLQIFVDLGSTTG